MSEYQPLVKEWRIGCYSNNDEDLSNELSQAVEILYKKYHT